MNWIGISIAAIGAIHTLFGLVAFRATVRDLIDEGLWNTVNGQPNREMAFWFLFSGLLLMILGRTIGELPADVRLRSFLLWAIGGVTCLGVIIMPVSGFWVMFIPLAGLVGSAKQRKPV